MHCQVQVLHAGGQIRKKHHPFLSPHRGYLKVMAIMSFVDAFWILLYFPLIVAFPRIWRKTARRQHVASPLYQLADVLHSMGSGGTSFGDVWNWRENFGHKTHNSDFGLRRRHAQMPHKLRFHLCFFFFVLWSKPHAQLPTCLDKCTPFNQPYAHKLQTCCLRVQLCLLFAVSGYISG